MNRDEVASPKLREIVKHLKISGLPKPVQVKDAELKGNQERIFSDIVALAKEEKGFPGEHPSPESAHWNLRLKIRSKLQEAVEADMIFLGVIQRQARGYGAIPDHEKPHNWRYFILPDNNTWLCWECGSEIQAVEQSQSVHWAEFTLAGSGEVRRTIVPYCPKCEPKPGSRGIIRETVAESIEHDLY